MPAPSALPLAPSDPLPVRRTAAWTRAIADELLHRLANGALLHQICDGDRQTDAGFLPGHSTILRWVVDDHNGFAEEYRRARAIGWDVRAERLMALVADSARDFRIVDGKITWDGEHVQRHRLQVDVEKWILAKMRPERYSDAVNLNVSGSLDINRATDAELLDQVAQLLRTANVLPSLQQIETIDMEGDA